MSGKAWTNDEIERLAQLWDADLTVGQIADELGRSDLAVQTKVTRVGLSKNAEARLVGEVGISCTHCHSPFVGRTKRERLCEGCRTRKSLKPYESRPVNAAKKQKLKLKPCLSCRMPFRSEGKWNWICGDCKNTELYRCA